MCMKMELFIAVFFSFVLSGNATSEDISLGIAGWEKFQGGDYKGAIALFERCISEGDLTKASLARTHRNIGLALRLDKRPDEAIKSYNKAIELKPDDVHQDYVNRGNAYSDLQEFEKALLDYAEAQKLFPDYNEAYYNRGIVFERQDKVAEAIDQFKLAYKFGLRSQLLHNRFVAHGLIK
jgi:tetratricopeptide (TPR) repeat protein